jgi:hypothetical protein
MFGSSTWRSRSLSVLAVAIHGRVGGLAEGSDGTASWCNSVSERRMRVWWELQLPNDASAVTCRDHVRGATLSGGGGLTARTTMGSWRW